MENEKQKAYATLQMMEDCFNHYLPSSGEVNKQVKAFVKNARVEKHRRYNGSEGAFTAEYLIPSMNRFLIDQMGFDAASAKESFLTEKHRHFPDLASGTPARAVRHPFKKTLTGKPKDIYAQWCGDSQGAQLVQSCPDFALVEPFPHKILFEAKYFSRGSLAKAQTELVTDIYQAFFYRGLPYSPPVRGGNVWDYDYACLYVFDASSTGVFKEAWEHLDAKVKRGFWAGAGLYVMILRGNGA